MAPITKEALKGLIKECLIEILSEGVSSVKTRSQEPPRKAQTSPIVSPKKTKSIFDQLDEARQGSNQFMGLGQGKRKDNPISNIVMNATSDPILQSILAETAATTLQEQIQHEQMIPKVPSFDPSSLYAKETNSQRANQSNRIVESVEESDSYAGPAAGLDISSLFGSAVSNWEEVLQRADKTRP